MNARALAAALGLIGLGVAVAITGNSKLSGRLVPTPESGTTVTLEPAVGGSVLSRATVDADGGFEVESPETPGSYLLTASLEGKTSSRQLVEFGGQSRPAIRLNSSSTRAADVVLTLVEAAHGLGVDFTRGLGPVAERLAKLDTSAPTKASDELALRVEPHGTYLSRDFSLRVADSSYVRLNWGSGRLELSKGKCPIPGLFIERSDKGSPAFAAIVLDERGVMVGGRTFLKRVEDDSAVEGLYADKPDPKSVLIVHVDASGYARFFLESAGVPHSYRGSASLGSDEAVQVVLKDDSGSSRSLLARVSDGVVSGAFLDEEGDPELEFTLPREFDPASLE